MLILTNENYICVRYIASLYLLKGKTLQKQVVFYTLINYVGTAIGVVSALFIYPKDFAFSGTVKFVDNIAQMLYPVMVLGASHALIKFYPALEENKRKQLFNYSLISISVISVIVLAGLFIFNTTANYHAADLLYFAFPVAMALAIVWDGAGSSHDPLCIVALVRALR